MAEPKLVGGLMVCGTTSDAGKSTLVTGLCRALARRGVRVAPFKAQNMALNSYVTADGGEIGRAQGVQALAAGVEPDVAMNPILLKPTGERSSQVIVRGPPGRRDDGGRVPRRQARPPAARARRRWPTCAARFDVVLCEGAGSPAEINLLDHDVANLRIAAEAGLPAIVVGDIDRGGVFAALYGTVALLPEHYRRLVAWFRRQQVPRRPGACCSTAPPTCERRCGVPTLGVLPMLPPDVVAIDAEDSLALDGPRPAPAPPLADPLDVAVVRFPVHLERHRRRRPRPRAGRDRAPRAARRPSWAGPISSCSRAPRPPSPTSAWLRAGGWPAAIEASGADVLGICGGYQMLGDKIDDPVESGAGVVEGLGWLPVRTDVRRRQDRAPGRRHRLRDPPRSRRGRRRSLGRRPGAGHVGARPAGGRRRAGRPARSGVAERRGKRFVPAGVSFAAARAARFDALADAVEAHLDRAALDRLIGEGRP